MTETKTEALNIRIKPTTKRLLERIAAIEERSLAQVVERLIVADAERRGIAVVVGAKR